MFPILGGRLLKQYSFAVLATLDRFPILGGRLLKLKMKSTSSKIFKFPILGGRLLKSRFACITVIEGVSNPWREAIEGKT